MNRQEIKGRHGSYFVFWEPSINDNAVVKVAVRRKFLWLIPFDYVIWEMNTYTNVDSFQVTYWDKFTTPYKKAVEDLEQSIDTKIKLAELKAKQNA
jgi:hypothetical protein